MVVLSILGVTVALVLAASLYVRKAHEYLLASQEPWDRLVDAADRAVQDESMPDAVVAYAAASVVCAGCGCITTRVLLDYVRSKLGFRRQLRKRDSTIDELAPEQRGVFADLVLNTLHYDSLRAPLLGFVLRRLALPWLRAAAEGAPILPNKVGDIAASTKRAITAKAAEKLCPAH